MQERTVPRGLVPPVPVPPRSRRPVIIVWLFVAITVLVLVLAIQGMGLLAAGRAYVAGESLWSKGQKDAVYYLQRYALERDDADFVAYERALAFPLGDRLARLELDQPEPDIARVRAGFLQGGNHADDIDGMIRLYLRFRDVGPIAHAISVWATADGYIMELGALGASLRAAVKADSLDEAASQRYLADIRRLNATLTPLSAEFSGTLGDAQRTAQSIVVGLMLAVSAFFLVAAIGLSRRLLRQREAVEGALRENEAQMRQLVESAPLPLLIVGRRDESLLYANSRALQQFGLTASQAKTAKAGDFYLDRTTREAILSAIDRDGSIRDFEVEMQDRMGLRFWAVISSQRIRYAGQSCLLTALVNIDDRKRLQDDMRFRAFHDALTGLPNRAMFLDALDRALKKAKRTDERFSVLFIDLDRFKVINDTLGHFAGDRLLQAVAERLREGVRESDLVARLGGDEFVILAEGHGGPEDVSHIAEKVLQHLERPFAIDGREVALTASIGISSHPDDGDDLDELVKSADIAMYQAKEEGRNAFRFYAPSINKLTLQRFDLEARLRGAIERDELCLQYQPVVDLATGEIRNLEALIRWNDPKSGLIMPGEFIPIAEETGAILAIGRWVLERACRDLKGWDEMGLPHLSVAVNVSARQVLHHALVNEVFEALQQNGISPDRLELEITESMMMHDPAGAERALRSLKGLGVRLAVDDFGTGYSSLSLVRRFPFDTVKIDRSFVSGCPEDSESMAIVQSVATLARLLGLAVIAEGVETSPQRLAVAAAGCPFAQGYLFSRPVDVARVPEIARAALGASVR
jgi:diguanylate cyclase (GGDEF)-like protein/PAS domain S-box-containing protein